MFTLFAQTFGILFVVSLLYVMVAECRACNEGAAKKSAQKQVRFQGGDSLFARIASVAAHYGIIQH